MLLGGLATPTEEFGGTQYAKVVLDSLWGKPPSLDMEYEKRVQETVRDLVRERRVESAHDVGEGGLAVALAECDSARLQIGADVTLDSLIRPRLLLFDEAPSRVLVSTNKSCRTFYRPRKKVLSRRLK